MEIEQSTIATDQYSVPPIIKEELSSEKTITNNQTIKVKDICIDEGSRSPKNMTVERERERDKNISLNFDHSVVDGVIAIELARDSKPKFLSGPVSIPVLDKDNIKGNYLPNKKEGFINEKIIEKKLDQNEDQGSTLKQLIDQGEAEKRPQITTNAANTNQAHPIKEISTDDSSNLKLDHSISPTATTTTESNLTNQQNQSNNNDLMEEGNSVASAVASDYASSGAGSSEKPSSPLEETSQNNTVRELGFPASIITPRPVDTSSQVPNSGNLSHRSDSSTTSARSFAFPVLQREWNSSPVKMAKSERGRFRKCGGWTMSLLCCKF